MSISDLDARRRSLETARAMHPAHRQVHFTGTGQGLIIALAMLRALELDDVHVHVHQTGRCVTFDLSGRPQPAMDMRYAAQRLGMVLEERPTETPDGCAAVELRASDLLDGVLRTIRAVVPIPAVWPL